MRPVNVGMIGYGFMGRAHSNAYLQVGHFFELSVKPVLKACSGRDKEKLASFADAWGYESMETDWQKVVARDDIDLIDCCVPNVMHHDVVIAAAEAGKIVVCEKPLCMNAAEGEAMGHHPPPAHGAQQAPRSRRARGHRPHQGRSDGRGRR